MEHHPGEHANRAIFREHWKTIRKPTSWVFTQEAVDYLKQKQYNGDPVNENRSGEDE